MNTGSKKSEGRQETQNNCVCIHGYVQPQPFLERIYPQLVESDDGFVDRLLLCFQKFSMKRYMQLRIVYNGCYMSIPYFSIDC